LKIFDCPIFKGNADKNHISEGKSESQFTFPDAPWTGKTAAGK